MPRSVRRRPAGSLLGVLVVVAISCTDTVPAATSSPPTAMPPPGSQPIPADTRQPDDAYIAAEIAPNVATADQRIVVAPFASAQPTCGITMAFYDPYLWGDGELIGVLLATGEWVPHDPSVSTTVLACLPPPVSDPMTAHIPTELVDGLYRACIGTNGCDLLRIVRPGELPSEADGGIAAPIAVAPGDEFVVTPGDADARVCHRFELHVGVGDGLELVGFPTTDGNVSLPVPGATTTVPLCGVGSGVPPGPVTFVAPDVPTGHYLFCLASRFDPFGCARVTIER